MEEDQNSLLDENVNEVAVRKREQFEASIANNANIWGFSHTGLEAKKAAMTMLSTKHGLYASVPIVCKSHNCPYKNSCKLLEYDLTPIGEPCPIEVAQIEKRYVGYSDDFDLANASFTDNVIVNELIETDIMMERCKKLVSEEALPIQDVVINITEDGEPITQPQVSKTVELSERLSKKRSHLLGLMKATRKDKKDVGEQAQSLTEILAEVLQREEKQEFIIDVKPDHLD